MIKYKQHLVIRKNQRKFIQNEFSTEQFKLFTCFCFPIPKGDVVLEVRFNKNIYYANEKASLEVKIDNSQSKIDIKDIEIKLEQLMILRESKASDE